MENIYLSAYMSPTKLYIPGIPGIGEKTATKLILQFGSIENMIAHVDDIENVKLRQKIEEGAQSAMMSKRLATIVTNVPVDYTIEDCRIGEEDRDRLIGLYNKLEFKTYLKKLMEEGGASADSAVAEANAADGPALTDIEAPESLELTDGVLDQLKDGQEIYLDIATDANHKELPSVEMLQICDGKTVWTGRADLTKFSGKAFSIK